MIKTLFALALAAATFLPAAAQTSSSFFGPNGSFAGSAITRGNPQAPGGSSTSFYGSNGHFTGSSITRGRETTFYDRNGHFTGSVIQQDAGGKDK
jgi:hypothetical protein